MVTAESLFIDSGINPADLGKRIVPTDTPKDEQEEVAVEYIRTNILPFAISEVSVPLLKVGQGSTIPLTDSIILRKYPKATPELILNINEQIQNLYDACVTSYGKFLINKTQNSNVKSYDEDADSDRKTATDQLQKLLDYVEDIITGTAVDAEALESRSGRLGTTSVMNNYIF